VYRLGECGISSQSSSNQSLARSSNNPAVSTAARTRLTLQTGVFLRWLARAAVLAAIVNAGALDGIFARSGPLNPGNGAIADPRQRSSPW
jgi:hypothetical protein